MKYKEENIKLRKADDLKKEMPCLDCGKTLKRPDYKCETCKKQLVFWIE